MYGTIIGDIAGSYYEMYNIKTKRFKFMDKNKSSFTDDTVMTLAVCKSLLEYNGNYDELHDQNSSISCSKRYCWRTAGSLRHLIAVGKVTKIR